MNDEEKIKWILENWGKAKARAKNLEVKAKNLQYSLAAKTSVGGRGSGDGPSEQERHVGKKDEIEFDARALHWNIEAIEESVSSLPEKQLRTIKGKFLKGITHETIGRRLDPPKSRRQVFKYQKKALNNLLDRELLAVYETLKNLLEE